MVFRFCDGCSSPRSNDQQKITIEQKWHEQSEAAKNEAERLRRGKERCPSKKARQSYTLPRKSMNGCHRQSYGRPSS